MEGGERKDERGLSESLREAIERTFAASAEAGERAQGLLDEVARRGQKAGEAVAQRGQEAREAIAQRGQDAGEASAGAAARVVEAIEAMRLATREDLRELEDQVSELAKRVAALEGRGSKPKVEG
jgi:polyhydroxyalkanoate synthesis regulator phasin